MRDWKKRAEITGDVVFFNYASDVTEKEAREVYIWDLDKTYLDTRFESLEGLFRAAVEKAFQKRNIPGTATLVRALRNSWQAKYSGLKDFPIFFITASPPQIERKIHEKLNLDGIYPYGVFFKDNLKNLRPGRLRRLMHQVGYKLQALLQVRQRLSESVRLILWGDDSESDAIIYSLFADICSRRLEGSELRQLLEALMVTGQQVDVILSLQTKMPVNDPVEKIYINLEADTDAEYYLKFGRRVLPTYNSFQAALDLFQDQRLKAEQVVPVAQDLVDNYGFTREELEKSFDDLVRRQVVAAPTIEEIKPLLIREGLVHEKFQFSMAPRPIALQLGERVLQLEGNYEPWVPERIDYLHDYR